MTREQEITRAADAASRYESPSFFEAFVTGAEWADSHPRWISVGDELPKEEGWILICSYSDVDMWYYNGQTAKDLMDYASITHWMPLPQAPVVEVRTIYDVMADESHAIATEDEKGGENG